MSKPKTPEPKLDLTETETDIEPETEEEQDLVEEPAAIEEGEDNEEDNEEESEGAEVSEEQPYSDEEIKSKQGQDEDNEEIIEPKNDIDDTEVMTYKSLNDEECIYDQNDIIIDDTEYDASETIVLENKITKPYLTKYEHTCLLSNRVQQLSLGAKPMIKNFSGLSPDNIARLEIKNKVIPLIILRPLPNKKTEKWRITEFINI